jgi:hypothetical protein
MHWRESGIEIEPGFGWDPPPGYAAEPFRFILLFTVTASIEEPSFMYVDAVSAEPYVTPPPQPPPIPPQGLPVTFEIKDSYGNPLYGAIYLEGYLLGYTTATVYLPSYYQTGVSYQLYTYVEGHSFQFYVTHIGEYSYSNPSQIYVVYPAIATAVYS